MSDYVPPKGDRFSQLYLQRGASTQDSERLRVRVAGLFQRNFAETSLARDTIETRLGADIGYVQGAHDIAGFLKRCPSRDFYDFVTVFRQALDAKAKRSSYTSDQQTAWD